MNVYRGFWRDIVTIRTNNQNFERLTWSTRKHKQRFR